MRHEWQPVMQLKTPTRLTDQQLVGLALRRDEIAFADLFDRYRPKLARVIARVIESDDPVEDLVQVTFAKAFRILDRYRPELPFAPWICRIARNVAIDHKRRMQLEEVALEEVEAWSALGMMGMPPLPLRDRRETPVQEFEARELGRGINEAIEQIPYKRRLCFLYYYVDGMTYDEIAYIFDISAETAKKRANRVRKAVQRLLEPARAG